MRKGRRGGREVQWETEGLHLVTLSEMKRRLKQTKQCTGTSGQPFKGSGVGCADGDGFWSQVPAEEQSWGSELKALVLQPLSAVWRGRGPV